MEYKEFLYSIYNQELVDKAYELSKEIYNKSDFESDINFYEVVTKAGVDSDDEMKRMYNKIYENITYAFLSGAAHAVKSGIGTTNLNPSEISFSDFRKNVDFAVFFDYSDNDFSSSIEAAAQAYCDEFNRVLGQIDMYDDVGDKPILNNFMNIENYKELCKVETIKEIMKCGFMADRMLGHSNTTIYFGNIPKYESAVKKAKEDVRYIPWDGERSMFKKVDGKYVESEKFDRFVAGTRAEIESILKKYGEPEKGWNDDFPVWCNAEVVILYMKNGYLTYVVR
jgi:hypothetical protein